uniref:F5/8 type C domain-containing protein n=1 Tax=Amphora coffeiformis TaxID=265554 RepID=A0A7S3LFT3_9STRA
MTLLSHHRPSSISLTLTTHRASSILQRNAKVYGPTNALRDDSSSWNSEGGDDDDDDDGSHWFRIDFGRPVQPTRVGVQFQAGFCAQQGRIECNIGTDDDDVDKNNNTKSEWVSAIDNKDESSAMVEWDDVHELQMIPLRRDIQPCTSLRLVLEDCTDFYGRVILYQVQVWGKERCTTTTTP